MKKYLLLALCLGLATVGLAAQTVDYQAILKQIDDQTNFLKEDITMSVVVVTDKPGKDRSIVKAKLFRRDREKKFLILMDEPVSQKGEGYLQYNSTSLKFYDPNTRAWSFTSLKEKFSDSQADNDDFTSSKMSTDYKVVKGEEGKLGKIDVYILTLEGTNDKVTYPMNKIWVTRDKSLVLKEENYSFSKRLMRTNLYNNYQLVNGHYVPLAMLFVDALTVGQKSQMSMSDVNIGQIPDRVFSEAYVEQVSK